MKKLFYAIAALILTTSCEKEICIHEVDPIECPNGQVTSIYGTWSWCETSGGIHGGIQTPNSTSNHVTIEFNENETYSKFINGVLTETSKFKSIEKISSLTGKLETFIEFIPNFVICPPDSIVTISPVECGLTTTWIESSGVIVCGGEIIAPIGCGITSAKVDSNGVITCETGGVSPVDSAEIITCILPLEPFVLSKYFKVECNTLTLYDDFADGYIEKFEYEEIVPVLY
tara:strand:+ start:623 stop:1312 length:690 start_codon:yes stop_codon:yes gene_type:complete